MTILDAVKTIEASARGKLLKNYKSKEIKELISKTDELAKLEQKESAELILDQIMNMEDCPLKYYNDVLAIYLFLNNFTKARKIFELKAVIRENYRFEWSLIDVDKLEKRINSQIIEVLPDQRGALTFNSRRGLFQFLNPFKIYFIRIESDVVTIKRFFSDFTFSWSDVTDAVFSSKYYEGDYGGGERIVRFRAKGKLVKLSFCGECALPDTSQGDFENGYQLLKLLKLKMKI